MRIAFLTSANAAWGAEQSLSIVAKGLVALGHTVLIVSDSKEVAGRFRADGITGVVEISHRGTHLSRIVSFRRALRELPDLDAVVLFSVNLYPMTWVLRGRGRPAVLLDIHDNFDGAYARGKVIISALGADRSIVISEFVRKQLPGWMRSSLVPRPMEIPDLPPRVIDDVRVIGVVGRLVPEKRIDLAIRAIAQIDSCRLSVFGSSFSGSEDYARKIQSLAAEVAPGRVIFHGHTPPARIYEEIDLLVVCNPQEASGRTVGEAMARAVPVLVPDLGGAREFILGDGQGFFWESNLLETGLRDALTDLMSDSDRLRSVAAAGHSAMRSRHPLTVAELYQSAVGLST